ncbi:Hypothetical protein AAM4_1439 [Actinomyces succiniciruminis]|uniref:Uncharacterized protein n=1 Tax=Actinomyces succiniciruminis TaxID=1522002 RepID=A0A1L7RBL5_9ACTO|nr:Hypothetical protein AAM4_1439 [Actinomyces succiniciruminis]
MPLRANHLTFEQQCLLTYAVEQVATELRNSLSDNQLSEPERDRLLQELEAAETLDHLTSRTITLITGD